MAPGSSSVTLERVGQGDMVRRGELLFPTLAAEFAGRQVMQRAAAE